MLCISVFRQRLTELVESHSRCAGLPLDGAQQTQPPVEASATLDAARSDQYVSAMADGEKLHGTNGQAKPKRKGGRPTKATDERMAAILDDIAQGMTEEQACAGHGIHFTTWYDWKKKPEYANVRARAQYLRIKWLMHKQETEPVSWKRWEWQLERIYKTQFGDPAKIQINQQFNNGNLSFNETELEEARQRLDETRLQQQKRKAGVATNAELLEHVNEQIEELQYLRDRLLAGETPDHEDQQKLYHLHEESSDHHEEQPIKEAIGHVVGKPLALEGGSGYVLEPEPTAPAAPPPPSPISQAPSEPEHVRQCDRKLPIGPPSERQRQRLEWERPRRGGDGKGIF